MNQDTNSVPDTDDDLAGQYVLGALSPEEQAIFEARLTNNVELQKAVNQWQAHFLSITDRLDPLQAPQPLSARIERSLDELEQQSIKDAQKRSIKQPQVLSSFWQSLALWRGISATCLAVAMVFAIQLQTIEPIMSEPTYIAVLVAPENKTPGWVIQTSQNTNQMQLVPLAAVQIPEGKALQFWTKAEGWDAPVSLGLVKRGETLNVDINTLPPLTENQLFELTLEQETGSPTGKPTGPITSIGRGVIML
ncbi:RNA polymerase subunit sigma-70 [Marinomonas ushuaiensis DSM 15871]|uniref:RNA polymerase subunit sigma-70 n=1 Tax=Marinomonas ushuaiensis DSM 15871 TaxID=1122207 RepID=X7E7V2_9GAMM|nr:anti-sigma factor [Marinomonas ushuaiensis]ETX11266.1 RNA polymerase subunit sigma-70 [Marinomonas ushuaiensis DSM 15871]